MSLRGFHLVFITFATLFCIVVATWSLYFNAGTNDLVLKILGWTCAVAAALLPIYGAMFYKKSKQEHLAS